MTRDKIIKTKVKKLKKDSGKIDEAQKIKKSKIENDEEQETCEPTEDELLESRKPENIKNIETVNMKKMIRHQKNINSIKANSKQREKGFNQIYLNTWKNNQHQWKFEKLRQVSIQKNIFVEDIISQDIFDVAVEYLSKTKGSARILLIKNAEKIICEIDEEKAESKNSLQQTKYQRARQLLQNF